MILGEVEYTAHRDAEGNYVAEGTPGAETIRWGGLGWGGGGGGGGEIVQASFTSEVLPLRDSGIIGWPPRVPR